MRYFIKLFTSLFVMLLLQGTLFAQDSKPDSLATAGVLDSIPVTPIKKPMFNTMKYRFIGDGNFTRGNVNRTLFVFRTELVLNGPLISLSTNPRFTYGKQNGIVAERDGFLDLMIDVFKERKTYLFGMAILENSNLRKIELREMAGLGIGFRILTSPKNQLSITNAVLYESTDFKEIEEVTTLRNSVRVKGKHSFNKDKIRLSHLTFVQPSLNKRSNMRWNTLVSLELPINQYVTLRSSFENSFESVVSAGRKKNDSRLTFGVSFGNK
jgi:hypothetical protein